MIFHSHTICQRSVKCCPILEVQYCTYNNPILSESLAMHRVPTPSPRSLRVAKTGKNHLNEEITPLLPTGIGERFSQTISNLGHEALLRRCGLLL
jgi:hypothetical protein